MCRDLASNDLVLLVTLWLLGAWAAPKGKHRGSLPSQLLPSQQQWWQFNFSVSEEVSWWNKFNQLFLFSFGHAHAIFASLLESVNLLWAHYFFRVSLKLWQLIQLILRSSRAKTIFFNLFFPPKHDRSYTWALMGSGTSDGGMFKQIY